MSETTPNPVPTSDPNELAAPAWVPTLLLHILYPDSRKVGFAWVLFLLASYAAFFGHDKEGKALLDASNWLLCTSMTSLLIGGGTIMDAKHEIEMAKINAGSPSASAS